MLWVLILFQWLLDAKISGGVSLLYNIQFIGPCVRDLMQHDIIIGGSKCVPVLGSQLADWWIWQLVRDLTP